MGACEEGGEGEGVGCMIILRTDFQEFKLQRFLTRLELGELLLHHVHLATQLRAPLFFGLLLRRPLGSRRWNRLLKLSQCRKRNIQGAKELQHGAQVESSRWSTGGGAGEAFCGGGRVWELRLVISLGVAVPSEPAESDCRSPVLGAEEPVHAPCRTESTCSRVLGRPTPWPQATKTSPFSGNRRDVPTHGGGLITAQIIQSLGVLKTRPSTTR